MEVFRRKLFQALFYLRVESLFLNIVLLLGEPPTPLVFAKLTNTFKPMGPAFGFKVSRFGWSADYGEFEAVSDVLATIR